MTYLVSRKHVALNLLLNGVHWDSEKDHQNRVFFTDVNSNQDLCGLWCRFGPQTSTRTEVLHKPVGVMWNS